MTDEALLRLAAYHGRRYWLPNGWSIRFRVWRVEPSEHRPFGVKYSFTLHDVDGTRLLGFDNAHGIGRERRYDHRHRFLDDTGPVRYEFRGADELITDFFAAVEHACHQAAVPFEFESEQVEVDESDQEKPDGP